MIIRNIETTKGTVTKLEVESEDNRITNKKYEFFLKSLFLGKNDKIEDYLEVGYNIWGMYVKGEMPKTEVEVLSNRIDDLDLTLADLEMTTIETDDVILNAVAESTENQDVLADVLLCAVDEMYQLIEPNLGNEVAVMTTEEQTLEIISHGLANLYLMMVKRNLKTLDTVPVRYRAYIEEHI